ncbi:MAG: hypothetical protein IJ323_03815 [Clostridia bacterium]|nr:hypothetical protein [Clostridia bacterium]
MRKYRFNNKSIGVIKEFDNLWRLVIPKEMRDLYKFGKEVEILTTPEGVLIRNPEYHLVKVKNPTEESR